MKTIKKHISMIMIFAMVIMCILPLNNTVVSADTTVKIGQACNDERGKLKGGQPGDQTGGEVAICKWTYSSKKGAYNNWKYVFRAKKASKAKKLCKHMIDACENNNIGYDQGGKERRTLDIKAKEVNWDISKINEPCSTTCSQVIGTCLRGSGFEQDLGNYLYTNNNDDIYLDSTWLLKYLQSCDSFVAYQSIDYTGSTSNLQKGDILISPGHHSAMVVSGKTPQTIDEKSDKFVLKKGNDYKLKKALNVRKGPGTNYAIKNRSQLSKDGQKHAYKQKKAKLKKGTVVTCMKVKGKWIKIPSGWICGKKANLAKL